MHLLHHQVPVANMDFETFTVNGAPGYLPDGQYIHFGNDETSTSGNNGNSGLDGDIAIPGWEAHEYADGQCTYGNNMAASGCEACTHDDGTSCGQGLFHQQNHDVSLGVNVLFLNSGYVRQQLPSPVQAGMTYIMTCEVGGGNGQNNGGYYFGFYSSSGQEITTISHQTGGPPASAQHFTSAVASFNADDHPDAIGQRVWIRLGKDQEGQAHYHSVTVQMKPSGGSTAAASTCAAETTSAGFCGQTGTSTSCTQSSNDPNHRNTGGTDGYGQGTGSSLPTTSSTSFTMQVCIDHQDDIFFQDNRIWFQYGGQYSATGAHGDCPADLQGKVVIDGTAHDISQLSACHTGTNCPPVSISPPNFAVPTGCQEMQTTIEKNPDATQVYNKERTDLITNRGT
jgi:hypothetical protein